MDIPGIFLHMIKSGWCFDCVRRRRRRRRRRQSRRSQSPSQSFVERSRRRRASFARARADVVARVDRVVVVAPHHVDRARAASRVGPSPSRATASGVTSRAMATTTTAAFARAARAAARADARATGREARRAARGARATRRANDGEVEVEVGTGDGDGARGARATTRRRALAATVFVGAAASGVGASRAEDEITAGAREALALAPTTFDDVELEPYVDLDNGYAFLSPKGWVKDLPNGIAEIEIHPVSEYGGRRFKVQVRPYGKKTKSLRVDELDEPEYANPRAYAEDVARKYAPLEGEGETNRGQAVSKVLSSRMSDDGRYYYFEYSTESMLPLHFWGVLALGPGPVGSARKLGRKDIITMTCQMPEDKGPEAAALLEHLVSTFKVLDV